MKRAEWWSVVAGSADDARSIRSNVRAVLERDADPERSDLASAELIVGELLGNVVRHADPPYRACLEWGEDPPIFCLDDDGPGMPPVHPVAQPDDEHGRGLPLVYALAPHVEIERRPGMRSGTRVIAALPVRARLAS